MQVSETDPLLPSGVLLRRTKRRWGSTGSRFCCYSIFGTLTLLGMILFGFFACHVMNDLKRVNGSIMPEAVVERIALETIEPEDLQQWCRNYTRKSHLAGQSKDLADWTRDKFTEFGLESTITPYHIYLNYPNQSSLSLVNKSTHSILFQASLKEDVLKEDPTTGNSDSVPVFHGYSANGSASGQFVYVNYGRKEDFDKLEELGIDIKGRIALVRYTKIFRGLKVKHAQDRGAIAVVIFSDPTTDFGVDFAHGLKPYPEGPARNPSSVERGSVGYLPFAPGDPTTPGYPSKKNARRKDPYDLIPSIPSIPISYADAIPILKELNGKGPCPKDFDVTWGGILEGVSYNIGPSDNLLKLDNNQDYAIRPIYNVIGRIDGIIPGQAVVIGNHRDAWVSGGAGDPNSGSAVLLSLAKALGELKKQGWRPLRTIILASWDGEEYALLGSTEWGEDHATYLQKNVVAYINLDMAVSGSYFKAGASPSLNEILREVTQNVSYPLGGTVYDHWKKSSDNKINTLGTGSDYTVFLDHLGIASVDFAFKSGPGDPVYHYHSNYDSFHWISQIDPDFALHATVSKLLTLLSLSLADRLILNFQFEEYGKVLKSGLDDILKKHKLEDLKVPYTFSHNEDCKWYDQECHKRHERKGHHNQDKFKDHPCKATTNKEHLKCLKDTLDRFIIAGKAADEKTAELRFLFEKEYPWYKFFHKIALLAKIEIANVKSMYLERIFLSDHGLDHRPWYKHILFAPNRYLGYGGTVFPGILEALEDGSSAKFIQWTSHCRGVLEGAAKVLRI